VIKVIIFQWWKVVNTDAYLAIEKRTPNDFFKVITGISSGR
jgi:hypothetical protein